MVVLKNWSIFIHFNDFTRPEDFTLHLEGDAYGDSEFDNGKHIETSAIISIANKRNHKEAITQSGTVFALYRDDVDVHCEELYPGYYDRVKDVEVKKWKTLII